MTEESLVNSDRRKKLPDADPAESVIDKTTDYTAESAPKRTFYINLKFFKFGTPDHIQGAAITVSVILLVVFLLAATISIWSDKVGQSLWFLTHLLSVTIGVAIGRNISFKT